MRILGFESSAKAASVAVCDETGLVAQSFQNSGLTHSRTLLPMAEDLLKNLSLTLRDIDLIAVSQGPALAFPSSRVLPGQPTLPSAVSLPWRPWPTTARQRPRAVSFAA